MTTRRPGPIDNSEKIVFASCTHDCGGRCILRVHVKNGVVEKIESDEGDMAELRACVKGRAYRQRINAPDRLKYPLKRVGLRGEGKFERISWNEALDTVANELKRVKADFGPSAILRIAISGSIGQLHGRLAIERLLNMFGGSTGHWGFVSAEGSFIGASATYGISRTANTPDDFLNSRLIILWGFNPTDVRWNSSPQYLQKARDIGANIVCIDPRFTDSAASLADRWIPIRPGTDAAMLIAMAYVTISEGLQNQAFIDTYTVGYEEYKRYVLGTEDGIEKTPYWAEQITGVPADIIADLARSYAMNRPAALVAGWGPGRTAYGEQFHRAACVLAAITGNIGIHGGHATHLGGIGYPPATVPFGSMPVGQNPVDQDAPLDTNRLPWLSSAAPRSTARIHVSKLFDALLEGTSGGYPADIKLVYVSNSNPINAFSNSNKGHEALQKPEFIVVHEQFMTSTAKYADILLPVNSHLEREDIAGAWMMSPPTLFYINKAVDSAYESKTDLEICTELAQRLGIPQYSDKTEEEWLREITDSLPAIDDFDVFKKKGFLKIEPPEPHVALRDQIERPEENRFGTPSGKIEIYSQTMADMKNPELPPIPQYLDPWEGPNDPLSEKYPLQLISVHTKTRVKSQFDNIPWLREIEPQELWINTADASQRNISDGDKVYVYNDRGKVLTQCKVTERMMPGVISMADGAWYNPDDSGVDIGGCQNTLAKDTMSPAGAFPYNSVLAQVEKA